MSMRFRVPNKLGSRFFAVLALFATLSTGSLRADDSQVEYDYYTSPEATSYVAVGLRGAEIPTDAACEVVFLINTSASQVGQTRDDSLATLNSAVAHLPEGTQVKLIALDVDADPLTADFVDKASPELAAALHRLARRVPLGATDMTLGLQAARNAFQNREPSAKRAVIYLGDGRSMAKTVDLPVFEQEVREYVDAHLPFNACAVGIQTNLGLIGAFANQTGGNLIDMNAAVRDGYDRAVDEALAQEEDFASMPNFSATVGKRLADSATATVVWPDRDSYAFPDSWQVYPKTLQPLRSDRETIVVAKTDAKPEPFSLNVKGFTPGNELELGWNFVPNKNQGNRNANKFLAAVIETAARDEGLTMPIVGWDSLDMIREGYISNLTDQIGKAETALGVGNSRQAVKILDNILRLDPDNATAKRLKDLAHDALEGSVSGSVSDNADGTGRENGNEGAADLGPLPAMVDVAILGQAAATQKVENEVRYAITDASNRMHQDPEAALQNLKMTQAMVRDDLSLAPDQRNSMLDRLGNMIKQTEHAQYLDEIKRHRAAMNESVLRERQQTLQSLEENRIKAIQIFDRFNALMSAGEYKVATQVAAVAADILPEDTAPFTADVLSTMVTYIMEYNDLRHKRHIGFVESLMESERSFIPIPDDPPITYIEPEKWLLLSERRKERYSVADLSNAGPAEKKISRALDRNIDLELDDSQTFEDLFNLIKDKNPGLNIGIDPKGAGALGITLSSPVVREPVTYHGIKLRSALRLILSEQDLTYCIKDEVLLITSEEEAQKYMSVKVYPMADLVTDPTPSGGSGGMGGMSSMMNGGGMGGMGGGGMGGMGGGGMGGMGGGMGGMGGGGFFSMPDSLKRIYGAGMLNGKPANGFGGGLYSVPPEQRPEVAPIEAQKVASKAAPQVEADQDPRRLVKQAQAASDPRAFWENYFASGKIDETAVKEIALRLIDQLRAKKRGKDGMQNAQAMKKDTALEDQIVALIESAILSGNVQPWMYEALALSLYLIDAPKKDLERAVLSAADFCNNPIDLMNIAMFANGVGLKERAFLLYKQAIEVMIPQREFHAAVLRLAQELNDEESLRWICLNILALEWAGRDGEELSQNALDTIDGLHRRMVKAGRTEEAAALAADIRQARRRDCIVTVQWTGDAGLDLSVREPTDGFCWFGNPRTLSGGILKTKPVGAEGVLSENSGTKQISYVCPKGFNGRYAVVIRKDWGQPANNIIKVSVATNTVSGQPIPESEAVPMNSDGAIVYFDLENGRRTETLEEGELDEAVLRADIARQQLARNNALKRLSQDTTVAQILGGLGGSGETNSGSDFGGSSRSGYRRYTPLYGPSVVGYRPVISILPDGASISPTAIVSADRRYVRIIDPQPQFNTIRKITPFNMQYGAGDSEDYSSSGSGNSTGSSGSY